MKFAKCSLAFRSVMNIAVGIEATDTSAELQAVNPPTCKSEIVVKLPTVASCTSVGHKRFTSIARLYGTDTAFCRPSCRAWSLTAFSSGVCLGSFRASWNGFNQIIIKHSVFSLLIWGFLGIFDAQMEAVVNTVWIFGPVKGGRIYW